MSASASDLPPPPVVGELIASSGTVLVRGETDSRVLHAWLGGAFGELLLYDIVSGAAITGPPPGTKGRPKDLTIVMLRLRAWEALYLAFDTQPPRLRIVAVPPTDASTKVASVFATAEAAAAAAASAAPSLDLATSWKSLREVEPHLPQLHAAYKALRAAGWLIRDGLKFGYDFSLYDGTSPSHMHALLGCLVLTREGAGECNWLCLQRHSRVCHGVGKGLLLCSVEPAAAMLADGAVDEVAHVAQLELGPLPMEVSTMRIDGWDPGKEHAAHSY